MSKVILVEVFHASCFKEMLLLAQEVGKSGSYTPKLLFLWPCAADHIEKCDAAKISYVLLSGRADQPKAQENNQASPATPTLSRRIKDTIKHISRLPQRWQWVRIRKEYRNNLKTAADLLNEEEPSLIILLGDRHVGLETALVKNANALGIPTLIVPYAISAPEGGSGLRKKRPDFQEKFAINTLFRSFVARVFPRWVYTHEGTPVLFLPALNALMAWTLGMMPANPWTIGGGAATRMAVESEAVKRMFLGQGVPEDKMVVTGKPSFDVQHATAQDAEAKREKLCSELGIDESHRIILCAVPQIGEEGALPWEKHWELTEFLFKVLASPDGVSVVLSLHQKSPVDQYKPLADKYGAVIAGNHNIYELIPLCDVFVAAFSSTVVLAMGAHKPAVVIDFYDLDYHFYDECKGLVIVRSQDDFEPTLKSIVCEQVHYDRLVAGHEECAPEWINMDGKCSERMIAEIDKLTC